jgi:UDP-N-acetylmuramoyl-tripeptide--D-alanyl-D-alanine ligase
MRKNVSFEEIYTLIQSVDFKICTDTRKIVPQSIFFALSGENFNGNAFAEVALAEGCSYAIVDDPTISGNDNLILVDNALKALQTLARIHRRRLNIPVIGITGSNGKTTTKELLYSVLSKKFKVTATRGNLNNHIGVPLTLFEIKPAHELAIVEMGANHQGEIAALSSIAEPNFGIITNIGKAHLEGFGGIEGVKKGKGELFDFIEKTNGKIFLNGDDPVLQEMAIKLDKITYGYTKLFDIVGKINSTDPFINFQWKTRYTASELKNASVVATQLVGDYNFNNLLCAVCVGNHFQISEKLINEAVSEYTPNNNRSQLVDTGKNKLILDMYNANPSSMFAAIQNFAGLKAENKIVILGDMLELGDETDHEHLRIIELVKEKKIESAFFIGKNFKKLEQIDSGLFLNDSSEALAYFQKTALVNKTILIKGSRGTKLETLLPAF